MLQAIAIAGLALDKFNAFFGKWFPGIVWNYSVKAQGAPTTPTRDVLHTALAAVFGMAVQRRISLIQVTANVDHNNNTVTVSYSIAVDASTMLIEDALERAENFATNTLVGRKILGPVNKPTAIRKRDNIARFGIIVGSIFNVAEALIQGEDPHLRDKALQNEVNKTENKVSPPLRDGKSSKPVTRGTNNGATTTAGLPWIISRQVESVLGLEPIKKILQAQVDAQLNENGINNLFELAPNQIYAGKQPIVFRIGNNFEPEPFNTILNNNNGLSGNPLLTRNEASNPQLPQAMGVDLKTLVAQVLFDPGTWPPEPNTDAGPPTIVGT